MWLKCIGVVSGVGVVVRTYNYRFPHINYPNYACISSVFAAASLIPFSFQFFSRPCLCYFCAI